ncbi:uncharacterized protein N7515_008708 [Penicillium bovifimosum]|uniref:Uncharacterized protein n=1 Tax=Penicillium bovifimosum TaxID=126998 RepID=A0A9W9KY31_9EURO|nr:uncharacterized protein N7515_008708 [Penicillium bovifimosum]KAJ5124883.1 hypothetical protein N7515_008708 [Penicillium bovifimosum]
MKGSMMSFNVGSKTIAYARREGEHFWLNCQGTAKYQHMLACNMTLLSDSTAYAVNKANLPKPISIDLAHRLACQAVTHRGLIVGSLRVAGSQFRGGVWCCTPYEGGSGKTDCLKDEVLQC